MRRLLSCWGSSFIWPDPQPIPESISQFESRPEAQNLISIFASLEGVTIENVIDTYGGREFSIFKKDLADLAVAKLDPITSEMNKLMDDPAHIDQILKEGKSSAISVAEPVLQKTKEIIGFLS